MAVSQAELKVIISAQDSASAAIKGLGGSLGGLEAVAGRVGGTLAGIGKAAAVGVLAGTAAITAAVAGGIKSAGDLQQSVANISTIAPDIDTSKVFASLNEMSTRVPQTAAQLGDSLYNVFSSIGGLSQDAALQLVETFAKGATAAGTDAQTFGTAITGVLNAYKLDVSDASDISDEFFAIVRDGVVTGQELATSLGPVLQSAKAAGVGFKELGPLIAAVTKEGGPAAQNINNLNNFLSKLTTKDAAKGFKALGISITDASGKFREVPAILSDLKDRLGDLTEAERANALQEIFPDLQARQGAQTLMSQLDFVNEALANQANQVGLTEQAYKKMSDTFKSQSQILKNSVVAAFTAIGASILPVITPLVTGLAQRIPDIMKTAGASFKAFSGDLYAAGQGISSFGENLKNIPVIGQGFNRTFGILGSAVTGFAALLRGDGAGAIEAFSDAFGQTQQGLNEFGGFVDRTIGGVLDSVGRLAGVDVTGVGGNFEKLGTIFETVQGRVTTAVSNILSEAGKLLGLNFAPDASAADKFSAIFDEIGRRIEGFKTDVGGKLDALTGEIKNLKISDDVLESFKALGSTAVQISSLADSMGRLNDQTKQASGFGVFAGALKVASVGALALANALAQVVDTIGFLFDFLGTGAHQFQLMGTALSALARGDMTAFRDAVKDGGTDFSNLADRADEFGKRFSERSHEISGSVQNITQPIKDLGPAIAAAITPVGAGFDAADAQVNRAAAGINTSIDGVAGAATAAADTFDAQTSGLGEGFDSAAAQVQRAAEGINTSLDILPQAAAEAAAGFDAIPEAAGPAFEQLPAIAGESTNQVVTTVQSGADGAATAAQSGLEQMVSTFLANFAETANAAEIGMAETTAATDAGMTQTVAAVETQAPLMTAAMDATGAAMTASAQQGMADVNAAVDGGMAQVPASVSAQEGPAGGAAAGVGQSIVAGLQGAILAGAGAVASAAAALVSGAINAARAAADAHSPSKKMGALGDDMWAGLNEALANGQIDQTILDAVHDYAQAAQDYLPVAAEIKRVEGEIADVRERATTAALFRSGEMIDVESEILRLKRDQIQAESDLIPLRQAAARAARDAADIERGSLADRQQMLGLGTQQAEIRLKEIALEKQLIGLGRDSKQAKGIQAQLDALHDQSRLLQLNEDEIRTTNRIAAAGAKSQAEAAQDAAAQAERGLQPTRDQLELLQGVESVYKANEAIIANQTQNEIDQHQRLIAVLRAQGVPIQDRIAAGLAIIGQLEREGVITKANADQLRALSKETAKASTGGTGATSIAAATQQAAAAVEAARSPFEQFQGAIQPVIEAMSAGASTASVYQASLVKLASDAGLATEPFQRLQDGTLDSLAALEEVAKTLGSSVNPAFTALLAKLQSGEIGSNEFTAQMVDLISKVQQIAAPITAIGTTADTAATTVEQQQTAAWSAVQTSIGAAKDTALQYQTQISGINTDVLDGQADAWKDISEQIKKAIEAAEEYADLSGSGEGGGGSVPSLAGGGQITRTGIALVHKGEVVGTPGAQLADAGTVITINGDVYGYDDFASKVGGVINTVAAKQSRERSRNLR